MPKSISTCPWTCSVQDVYDEFSSGPRGLTSSQVTERRKQCGRNSIDQAGAQPAWRLALRQFESPLVLILIGASIISFLLGEQTQTIIILLIVGLGAILAFVQEFRSDRALQRLRKKLTRFATVMRNGKTVRVDASELVLGDMVELEIGTVVPADLRLVSVEDLQIDESIMTGESEPVSKNTDILSLSRPLPQEQHNIAFSGTHVVQGSGLGIVVRIGNETEFGKTAALLSIRAEETSFQKGIRNFGNFLLKVTLALCVVVFIMLGLIHGRWGESLLFAIALAVGISPELLPIIVTMNLSRGALAMNRKHVLVKRLIAIEDLGNADVFCTDKTGTLTVGKLRVRESIAPSGENDDLPLAYASNCLELGKKGRATNPLDQAILEASKEKQFNRVFEHAEYHDIISFDFQRRRMSCVVSEGKSKDRWLVAKGAVSEMINVCSSVRMGADVTQEMSPEIARQLLQTADGYHDKGYRLTAVARRPIGTKAKYSPSDESGLELLGFVLVSDAPKDSAKSALEALSRLNTRLVVLTGDNDRVTRHVAETLGFKITKLLTGDKIEQMDDETLSREAERTNVFARITPAHKLRIIQALKKSGHTVGFMGDGVNDAPALRAADVGISFEDAVDVAKEAAGIILLKKNLSVLADGIREGRRTFVNTRTYIYATISSNFGNMLSVAGASLLLPFIPLLPAQILLLNLISDLPMLGISSDRVSEDELAKPQKWDIQKISNFMYFFGTISSLADYATFAALLFVARADIVAFRSGWFIESMLTEIVVIFLVRSKKISLGNMPSTILSLSAILVTGATFYFVQSGLGNAFGLTALPAKIIAMIIVIVSAYTVLTLLGKSAFYRFRSNASGTI
ncbi:MAG: magnesium-translocating P-type ATPase [Patescibacteria group bacterium]|nr:magnesium-translocating P-type ATPase [Patescibacteria group bacterium]